MQEFLKSSCSIGVCASFGKYLEHGDRKTASHVYKRWNVLKPLNAILAWRYLLCSEFSKLSWRRVKESICRKQKCMSEMLWIFLQPCILLFPLGCIFLCLLFLSMILTISRTPKLCVLPVIAYCRWFTLLGTTHSLLCTQGQRQFCRTAKVQLPQTNMRWGTGG